MIVWLFGRLVLPRGWTHRWVRHYGRWGNVADFQWLEREIRRTDPLIGGPDRYRVA